MPTVIDSHEYARDRAPIASTAIPTLWRYRWTCSCGSTGPWRCEDPQLARRGWIEHCRAQYRQVVPRSTTHRTTS